MRRILVIALLLFSVPAFAQETVLTLSATEYARAPQDTLIANLRLEIEDADPKVVQSKINEMMKAALEKAKKVETVKTSTGQYYVYDNTPYHEKDTPAPAKKWRGTQTLDLESKTAEDLLKLAGALQDDGLIMGGLNYTLSPGKADEAKDALLEKAIAKLTARAQRAAKALGKSSVTLAEVNVDAADNIIRPMPMMHAMAMDARMEKSAAPNAAPGETDITLTVTAKVLLK
jgi:predicted secreted protein